MFYVLFFITKIFYLMIYIIFNLIYLFIFFADLPQDTIIDLTEEDEEEEHRPGPSNADRQKRPREADASSSAPDRKKRLVAVVTPIRTVEEVVAGEITRTPS